MENFEENSFITLNDNGEEIKCSILFTFECDENGKNYIVYTDESVDEEGNVRVYASVYDKVDGNTVLLPIESEEEWDLIERAMEEAEKMEEEQEE